MPLDTFICGQCMVSFNNIEQFMTHKSDGCDRKPEDDMSHDISPDPDGSIPAAVSSVTTSFVEADLGVEGTDDQSNILSSAVSLPGTESLLANTAEVLQGDNPQTVIILQGDLPNLNLEGAGQLLAEMAQDPKQGYTIHSEAEFAKFLAPAIVTGPIKKKRGRGPGRPKKVVGDKPKEIKEEKASPDIGEDGRLTCTRCKRVFNKERMFNAHRCLALSEYVDFNTKEVPNIDPDDNHLPMDDLDDSGAIDEDFDDKDFKLPSSVVPRLDGSSSESVLKEDLETAANESGSNADTNKVSGDGDASSSERKEGANVGEQEGSAAEGTETGRLGPIEVEASPDIETAQLDRETSQIKNVPIFLDEKDKVAFEASLNIDLSGIDHLFRIHCIEQELNQNASQLSRFTTTQLSLYSCNVCDKVFKSLSHMRFHVLTHTELKPYKCIFCNYSSNARGNLYTHMRKHTGQYYRCDKCKFRTVNKSHLLEHNLTHAKVKRQCDLCKKHYNTIKSLMSHIRKYHDNAKGKEYLSSFMQGRDLRGSTVIHQCHVCNRKFKKKLDRDRHLFVHDIKDLPNTQHCDLCDYTASRPKYLERHFLKHRCIYRCCKCDEMFLSSIKLVDHLTSQHVNSPPDSKAETWETMFEASINTSLYLPEPDHIISKEEKDLINLPTELSGSSLDQLHKLQNSGEDDMPVKMIDSADVFINKVPAAPAEMEDSAVINAATGSDTPAVIDATIGSDTPTDTETLNKANSETQVNDTADNVIDIPTDGVCKTEDVMNKHADDIDTEHQGMEDEVVNGLSDHKPVEATFEEELTNAEKDNQEEMEDGDGDIVESGDSKATSGKAMELIDRLGYLPMTLNIFQKMRDTFGTEECVYCGRLFFSQVDYEPHLRTHTGDKPHVCQTCGFRAITQDNLKRHVQREHENITYPCPDCSYVAMSRTQLWNHSLKHKGIKGLECPECQEAFESIKEVRSHAALMHPNSNLEELDKLTSFKHKAQGKIGKRTYRCPHCEKVFFRASSELQKHMWIHEGIKPFKCPLCPHACRSKNNLQAHMLRHSKDKPFLCGHCGKPYKSKTALRWHVRSHVDGKPFKCDKCPYEATQKSHLKRHSETHEVKKRFACSLCDFSANTLGYLKIHYARFHKEVDPNTVPAIGSTPVEISQPEHNVYKCLSCDYLFGNLSDLNRHLRTRHHINVRDIQKVDDGQGGVALNVHGDDLQVLHVEDGSQPTAGVEIVTEPATSQTQIATGDDITNMDEKTASAVNILQQIIGMSQGVLSQPGEVGSILQLTPETMQDGNIMYVSTDGTETTADIDGNQYVIQYVTPQDAVTEGLNMIEVQGEEVETEVERELQMEVSTS